MRATNVVSCPRCTQPAEVTLVEAIDELRGSEGHKVVFSCPTGCARPSEPDLLRLWAASRRSAPGADGIPS